MSEKSGNFEGVITKIERAQAGSPEKEGTITISEKWRTPEEGAEELYALWRDYNRRKIGIYREAIENAGGVDKERKRVKVGQEKREAVKQLVESDTRLLPLRTAMRARWQDPKVQAAFKRGVEAVATEHEQLEPLYENYLHLKTLYNELEEKRLEIFRRIFADRSKEPEEMDLIDLEVYRKEMVAAERRMRQMERESQKLAVRLSFERIREYRHQLKKDGFIWTPSREELFNKILEHLVIVDQNRPFLLYGETGTGKTRLARAVSERLTGRAPFEVGEEAKTDIRPLLGLRSIDKEGSYVTYGQLGQAATGKKTSRDKTVEPGGLFYMDEMNGYPPEGLRALIKQLSGRRAGEEISFAAWAGHSEKLAPEFGFVGSANLPSEKHPDKAELPVEVARELASCEVDYPPQTNENPELYEMMLAALMDQNDRIRVSEEELPPAWKEVVDTTTKTKRFEVDDNPKSGGTLWRFANLVAHIQKSYKGEENALTSTLRDASYLRHAVLDPGLVLSWLQEYRKSAMRAGERLDSFLSKKISEWGSQKIYPEEDRNLVKKFQEEFQLT